MSKLVLETMFVGSCPMYKIGELASDGVIDILNKMVELHEPAFC